TWTGSPTCPVAMDARGRVRVDDPDLADASVVACQSANHEVGTLQPVTEVADLAGRVPGLRRRLRLGRPAAAARGWAALAASAHKWGGPPGGGGLVRRGTPWRAPVPEGDRPGLGASGFENVPALLLAAPAALQAVVAE